MMYFIVSIRKKIIYAKLIFLFLFLFILISCSREKAREYPLIVLGVDAISSDILEDMISQGELPNFKFLKDEGIFTRLTSLLYPESPLLWTSMFTGKNPGKHGIFGWYLNPRQWHSPDEPVFANTNTRKAQSVWRILSDQQKKSIVMNLPATYPPEVIRGYMITMAMEEFGFTHPPNLVERFPEIVWSSDQYPTYKYEDEGFAIRQWKKFDTIAKNTTMTLMKEIDWSLAWVYFAGADHIQHFYWKYYDKNHPRYSDRKSNKFDDAIPDYYKFLDNIIGEYLDAYKDKANFIVVSDHGFCPIYKFISAYNFLKSIGLYDSEDNSKTQVIYYPHYGGRFYINLKGREIKGVVEPEKYDEIRDFLIEKLKELRDPDTGETVMDKVYAREDIYKGRYVDLAPDIIGVEKCNYRITAEAPEDGKIFFTPSTPLSMSGYHRVDTAVFFAYGPDIKRDAEIKNISMLDITPTILYLTGSSIPDDLDGRVLFEIINDEFRKRHKTKFIKSQDIEEIEDKELKEDGKIVERLKSLGYIQ